MTQFILLAAADGGLLESARQTGEQFGFHKSMFIAQVISFLLVALLLRAFAYKPILKMLEQRRQLIAQGLENADRIKAELTKTESARQEILTQANNQANRLIEEARAAAARVQEVETQKAIAAAEQIIAKAREAASMDHARMLVDLKREIGQLVVRTTTQVTGKILTADDQRRLAEDTNRQIAA